MNRRTLLASVVVTSMMVALAACGDPNEVSVATESTSPPQATTAITVPTDIVHPTDPDEAILRLSYAGGLVRVDYLFATPPQMVIGGDGRVFSPAPASTPYPGPLVENIEVRHLTEAGLQELLGVVQRAGLLAPPPDYSGGTYVADAPDTVLVINAMNNTFTHSAYALGIEVPESASRQALADVVESLVNLVPVSADNIEAAPAFAPVMYRLRARPIDPAQLTDPARPSAVVEWPAAAGISLAAASECARVDAMSIGSLFDNATQNTYFKDGDVVYQLAVRGVLPGDPSC